MTGSCYLLEGEKGSLLVDCGMHQGERMCGQRNYEDFDFEPAGIQAVIVTHAHYDHIGRLPLLLERGFTGKVYMTPPTAALARLVMDDAHRIMAEQAEKCDQEILFGSERIAQLFDEHVVRRNYHTQFEAAPGMMCRFHEAGHILGSSFITVDAEGKRIVFSGDLGNDDIPILPDTESLNHADVIVTESTYGDKDHDPTFERKEKLVDAVNKVINRGGTLIIPAFSIERTQELLYELDILFDKNEVKKVPVYLDSPLAIKATQVYREFKQYLRFDRPVLDSPDRDFFSFPNLKLTLTREESKRINADDRPKIIIAGSGMMTGGRVQHHLRKYLPDERSGVLIIGYQAQGTLGRKIQSGARRVDIFHDEVAVRASIDTIHSFSAHADRKKIARWLLPEQGAAEKIFLVHGDHDTKALFQLYLKDRMESEVFVPDFNEEVEL